MDCLTGRRAVSPAGIFLSQGFGVSGIIGPSLMTSKHPMPVLLAFLVGAIAAAAFAPVGALVVVGGCLAYGVMLHALGPVLLRVLSQCWRLKWLLLATLFLMAWPVPGQALAEGLSVYFPSREGLELGLTQTARVLAVIALYCALPGALPLPQRTAGLYGLLRFLGRPGRRFAVRLALTLEALESMRGQDHWALLRAGPAAASARAPLLALGIAAPMRMSERLCSVALLILFGFGCWLSELR